MFVARGVVPRVLSLRSVERGEQIAEEGPQVERAGEAHVAAEARVRHVLVQVVAVDVVGRLPTREEECRWATRSAEVRARRNGQRQDRARLRSRLPDDLGAGHVDRNVRGAGVDKEVVPAEIRGR